MPANCTGTFSRMISGCSSVLHVRCLFSIRTRDFVGSFLNPGAAHFVTVAFLPKPVTKEGEKNIGHATNRWD